MNYDVNLISSNSSNFAYGYLVGFILAYFGIVLAVCSILLIFRIIARWRIYKKAGQKGWEAIVPFYSSYTMYKITWGMGWLFLAPVALNILSGIVPTLAGLITVIIVIWDALCSYKLSEAFGHKVWFAIGLFFLPTIFKMILAFNSDGYLGIPKDGTSYNELKDKADEVKANQKPIDYDKPE